MQPELVDWEAPDGGHSAAEVDHERVGIDRHTERAFFFSSRRRHTRFDCDWSSDVCSSDLRVRKRRTDCLYPREEAGAERFRVQLREYTREGVMRGNAVVKRQSLFEPFLLRDRKSVVRERV